MRKGVITYDHKRRLVDYLSIAAVKTGLIKTDGYYPILDNKTKNEVGQFVCVYGNGVVVRFLEFITDYRGKNMNTVDIDY